MSDTQPGRGRVRKAVVAAAGLLVTAGALTACGPGWWTPMATEEPTEVAATSEVTPTVEASVEAEPTPTLAVNVTDVPALWNAMASANGVTDVLPDPLVADDTIDGVSSTTLTIGDGTMFVQWQADDGQLLTVQLDTMVDGEPTTSSVVPVLEAFAATGLGLSPEEAPAFVATALDDAVANAVDPVFIDWTETSDSGDLAMSIVAGTGSFVITPTVDVGSGSEPVDDAASPAASE